MFEAFRKGAFLRCRKSCDRIEDVFTAESPQYHLPELRGKQRTQRIMEFFDPAFKDWLKRKYVPTYL